MHRIRLLAVAALLATAVTAPVRAGDAGAAATAERFQLPAHSTLQADGARSLRRADWVGGAYATHTGERVTVFVSTSYTDANALAQEWANFLSGLLHGSELGLVRAHIAPLAEVEEFCEGRVLGCYGGNTLVSIGQPVDDVTAEEVMRHEYGHHVAANRQNPPWAAVDWGTKRWASAADVCARVAGHTAFPGDEDLYYSHNPGEAFAEAYRVLNEVRIGAGSFSWTLADPSFSPGTRELSAVEDDVLRPWAPSSQRRIVGRFHNQGRTWTRAIATPLDGDLELSLRMMLGAGHTLEVLDSSGAVLARGLWSGSGVRTVRYRICGERSVRVRVGRAGGAARFEVRVNAP
jgi:hypothetical protein